MKKRTEWVLLAVCLLFCLTEAFFVLCWLEIVPCDIPAGLLSSLALYVPVIPAFCLQLLLCRVSRRWYIRAIPSAAVAAAALACGIGMLRAEGWDALGYLILLLLGAAPAAGCMLGWTAWAIRQRLRRKSTMEGQENTPDA